MKINMIEKIIKKWNNYWENYKKNDPVCIWRATPLWCGKTPVEHSKEFEYQFHEEKILNYDLKIVKRTYCIDTNKYKIEEVKLIK